MTQPTPEYDYSYEEYEDWRALQEVLEERNAEWWATQDTDEANEDEPADEVD